MFTRETTVRTVLNNYPATFAIFAAHGMCDDCKTAPPPVPLEHFANKHQVNLTQLLNELTACVERQDADNNTNTALS